jgi:hypothetical protein
MKLLGLQGCDRKQRGCALEDGKKGNTEIAETGATRKWVVGSGRDRRRAAAGRRGRSFEIWARTGATMGKGSAGVLEK